MMRNLFSLLGVVASLVLVGAACGSSDGGSATTEPPAPEAGVPPPPPPLDASDDHTSPVLPTDGPVNEQVVGSTRLRPKMLKTSDGAKSFVTWHDTKLDIDCVFQTAMDGVLRCLPSTDRFGFEFDRQWSDSGCKNPILIDKRSQEDSCLPAKYFSSFDETTCPGKVRVEQVGAAVTPTNVWYTERLAPNCTQSGVGNEKFYPLGPEIAPTEFVSGTISLGTAKDGVAASYVTADDGAKGYVELVDTVHDNTRCTFARSADGTIRCLPDDGLWGIVWEDLFTDGTCSSYWAQLLYYTKCPTKFGRRYDDRGSCNPKFFVHPVLASATGIPLSRKTGATCAPQGQNGDDGFFTGPEVDATTFSSVTEGPLTGATRLQRYTQVTSGGLVVANGWYDTKRSAACSFRTDSAGTLRCMAGGPVFFNYYGDMGCTQPLYQVPSACGGAPTTPPTTGFQVDTSTCPAHYRAYALGAAHVGAVWQKFGTTCSPVAAPPPTVDQGAEIAPTTFQDATEVVE
jgi:hypothetical protein